MVASMLRCEDTMCWAKTSMNASYFLAPRRREGNFNRGKVVLNAFKSVESGGYLARRTVHAASRAGFEEEATEREGRALAACWKACNVDVETADGEEAMWAIEAGDDAVVEEVEGRVLLGRELGEVVDRGNVVRGRGLEAARRGGWDGSWKDAADGIGGGVDTGSMPARGRKNRKEKKRKRKEKEEKKKRKEQKR